MISAHALDTVLQDEKLSFREPGLLYWTEARLMFASRGYNILPLFSKAVRYTAMLEKTVFNTSSQGFVLQGVQKREKSVENC